MPNLARGWRLDTPVRGAGLGGRAGEAVWLKRGLALVLVALLAGCTPAALPAATTAPAPLAAKPTSSPAATQPVAPVATAPAQAPSPVAAPVTSPAASPAAASSPAAAASQSQLSPFLRRDPAPAGVLNQVSWGGFGPNGVICDVQAGKPAAPPCPADIPGSVFAGLAGFDQKRPVMVQMRRPDGTTQDTQVTLNPVLNELVWRYDALPGTPLGNFQFTARQGSLQAVGTFTVRRASEPRIWIDPEDAPPGSRFRVAFGGFQAGKPISTWLYKFLGDARWFLSDLPLSGAVANDSGEALAELVTRTDDPLGSYWVGTEFGLKTGALVKGGGFSLRAPGPFRGPTEAEMQADREDLARTVIQMSYAVWSGVVGTQARPPDELATIFWGKRLAEVRAEAMALRGSGQRREARMTAPPRLLKVESRQPSQGENGVRSRLEVVLAEQWDDQLLDRAGTLVRRLPSRVERRYVIEHRFDVDPKTFSHCVGGGCSLVVEMQELKAE